MKRFKYFFDGIFVHFPLIRPFKWRSFYVQIILAWRYSGYRIAADQMQKIAQIKKLEKKYFNARQYSGLFLERENENEKI